ncbi:hypothetical protein Skr01_74830 [Sphaerisporangium krabiense]|uniref:DUF4241 domain-containing protein n=1 Tax=Sphaerisporangium krabiense TaxID=763782 RepID=A0A7W8Z3K4_9ACTN|nr:hypothetical protein [Sphaerisporangium krabiense]MBB5626804.1 hypothetical protein [Sphaerisporangium krabiense]GII67398.1 hypothetical protein Skr01_74830 [Sphaerisporangium krabiense]
MNAQETPDDGAYTATRLSLHAVAELLLAGPQYRTSGTIRLRVTPEGFGTVAAPDLRVEGDVLVAGATRLPLDGRSLKELGAATGAGAGAPEGLYHDGSGASAGDVLRVEAGAARYLQRCLALGDEALRAFAPGETPVLWPEHFDIGILLDQVAYGVSCGDTYLGVPYAYVVPWEARSGEFWNAPFGAARPMSEVSDVPGFFAEGRRRLTSDGPE